MVIDSEEALRADTSQGEKVDQPIESDTRGTLGNVNTEGTSGERAPVSLSHLARDTWRPATLQTATSGAREQRTWVIPTLSHTQYVWIKPPLCVEHYGRSYGL